MFTREFGSYRGRLFRFQYGSGGFVRRFVVAGRVGLYSIEEFDFFDDSFRSRDGSVIFRVYSFD